MSAANEVDMNRMVLHPIDGCYQINKGCSKVRETKTMIVVKVDGEMGERRFRKSDRREVSPLNKFPTYLLQNAASVVPAPPAKSEL